MLFKDQKVDTQLAVMQEKLNAYENMMTKVDEAIQMIGTTSQNISKMLAVHEEKLESTSKNEAVMFSMIDELKRDEREHEKEINIKIDNLANKVDQITNFRWLLVGGLTLITVIISAPSIFSDLLTPDPGGARIEAPTSSAGPIGGTAANAAESQPITPFGPSTSVRRDPNKK